jgi:hypothetical protein
MNKSDQRNKKELERDKHINEYNNQSLFDCGDKDKISSNESI